MIHKRIERFWWLGQSWPVRVCHRKNVQAASDAPVAALPGHRRDAALERNQPSVAALPQPPLVENAVKGLR